MIRQKGIGIPGIMALIVVVTFSGYTAFLLLPIYLDYLKVSSSIQSLTELPETEDLSPRNVRDLILRRFQINQVSHVGNSDLVIFRENDSTVVQADYEVRTPWFWNIDLVLKFSEEVEVGGR
ncbi:MAG: DUF4845 domain-containing protein [Pseudomonadota bacterium]|nr:DUF4845 domain-containing protein [Pseudomonadota bacterium]